MVLIFQRRSWKAVILWVSCITEIELLSYSALSDHEETIIRSFLGECSVIDLHPSLRELTIKTRKNQKLKIPDAIIAATSDYLRFPLVTMDSDFKDVPDLDVIILETK